MERLDANPELGSSTSKTSDEPLFTFATEGLIPVEAATRKSEVIELPSPDRIIHPKGPSKRKNLKETSPRDRSFDKYYHLYAPLTETPSVEEGFSVLYVNKFDQQGNVGGRRVDYRTLVIELGSSNCGNVDHNLLDHIFVGIYMGENSPLNSSHLLPTAYPQTLEYGNLWALWLVLKAVNDVWIPVRRFEKLLLKIPKLIDVFGTPFIWEWDGSEIPSRQRKILHYTSEVEAIHSLICRLESYRISVQFWAIPEGCASPALRLVADISASEKLRQVKMASSEEQSILRLVSNLSDALAPKVSVRPAPALIASTNWYSQSQGEIKTVDSLTKQSSTHLSQLGTLAHESPLPRTFMPINWRDVPHDSDFAMRVCTYCDNLFPNTQARRNHQRYCNQSPHNKFHQQDKVESQASSQMNPTLPNSPQTLTIKRKISEVVVNKHHHTAKTCRTCEKLFPTRQARINHEESQHSETRKIKRRKQRRPTVCPGCGEQCSTHLYLILHLEDCKIEPICSVCNKEFVSFDHLAEHRISHTNLPSDSAVDSKNYEEGLVQADVANRFEIDRKVQENGGSHQTLPFELGPKPISEHKENEAVVTENNGQKTWAGVKDNSDWERERAGFIRAWKDELAVKRKQNDKESEPLKFFRAEDNLLGHDEETAPKKDRPSEGSLNETAADNVVDHESVEDRTFSQTLNHLLKQPKEDKRPKKEFSKEAKLAWKKNDGKSGKLSQKERRWLRAIKEIEPEEETSELESDQVEDGGTVLVGIMKSSPNIRTGAGKVRFLEDQLDKVDTRVPERTMESKKLVQHQESLVDNPEPAEEGVREQIRDTAMPVKRIKRKRIWEVILERRAERARIEEDEDRISRVEEGVAETEMSPSLREKIQQGTEEYEKKLKEHNIQWDEIMDGNFERGKLDKVESPCVLTEKKVADEEKIEPEQTMDDFLQASIAKRLCPEEGIDF